MSRQMWTQDDRLLSQISSTVAVTGLKERGIKTQHRLFEKRHLKTRSGLRAVKCGDFAAASTAPTHGGECLVSLRMFPKLLNRWATQSEQLNRSARVENTRKQMHVYKSVFKMNIYMKQTTSTEMQDITREEENPSINQQD